MQAKIPDNIFWQAIPPPQKKKKKKKKRRRKKKKKVARIFAWIIPEFCPNFVRFLPEFLHWHFFGGGGSAPCPPPVSYAYALIIQVEPIVKSIMLQCLRLYFKTLNHCLISKCMIVLFSVNHGCYQLCLSFLEIKNRRNVELSPSNNDIEQNTFTCWSTGRMTMIINWKCKETVNFYNHIERKDIHLSFSVTLYTCLFFSFFIFNTIVKRIVTTYAWSDSVEVASKAWTDFGKRVSKYFIPLFKGCITHLPLLQISTKHLKYADFFFFFFSFRTTPSS